MFKRKHQIEELFSIFSLQGFVGWAKEDAS
jgi:hypothetical protein